MIFFINKLKQNMVFELKNPKLEEALGAAIGVQREFVMNADFCYPESACDGTRFRGKTVVSTGKDGKGQIDIEINNTHTMKFYRPDNAIEIF